MSALSETPPHERLTLLGRPASRKSPEEFLAAFNAKEAPTSPGCYLMLDDKDTIIYVGKAKNLRNRIRTYINDQDSRYSVKFLMRRVAHIDFLLTTNEKEAFLLENSLIKQHKPRYNVHLKDDKSYVSLRIDTKQDYPRITVMRRNKKDSALYFGPYSSAGSVRDTLRQIHRMFPLRTCSDSVMKNRSRPCIYYQMKQCVAPCVGLTDPERYQDLVNQAVMVLKGRNKELEKLLQGRIAEHAEKLEFEQAAVLRDRLHALNRTIEKQRTVDVPGAADRDVFGLYSEGTYAEIQVVFYRGGKMIGGRSYSFKRREMPLDEVLSSFLLQFYSDAPVIPAEVLLPIGFEELSVLDEILSEQRGTRCQVIVPVRGDKHALVDLATRNAKNNFQEKQLSAKAQVDLLKDVKESIKLRSIPNRIECFDISTHQGDKSVGSMVVFEGGIPNKDRYRRYAIKDIEGQDDFASMREVILRRYKRAIEENDLPDLVLIDGGKGQLNVARAALQDLGLDDLEVISIAKARTQEEGGSSPERFFVPGRSNPIILRQQSPVVLLMSHVRDEAHRFAITYHRKRRLKGTIRTTLTNIPGVGPERARKLLKHFGSVAKIKGASVEAIAEVSGISNELSATIHRHLRSGESPGHRGSAKGGAT